MILVGERLAEVARRAVGRGRGWPSATGARLAWMPAPGRRARRDRGGRAARAAAGRPPGHRRRRPRRGGHGLGRRRAAQQPGRDTGEILAAAPTGRAGRARHRRSRPRRPARPGCGARRPRRGRFVVSLELRASAVTDRADVVLPGRRGRGEGRHVRRLGGPGPPVRAGAAGPRRVRATCRCWTRSPTRWTCTWACPTWPPPAASWPRSARWDGAAAAAAARRPASRVAAPRPGEAVLATWHICSTTAACRTASRTWRARPGPLSRGCPRPPRPRLGVGRRRQGRVSTTPRHRSPLPVEIADMPDRVVWLPTNSAGCPVRRELGAGARHPSHGSRSAR